jgi:hypothetical protein
MWKAKARFKDGNEIEFMYDEFQAGEDFLMYFEKGKGCMNINREELVFIKNTKVSE